MRFAIMSSQKLGFQKIEDQDYIEQLKNKADGIFEKVLHTWDTPEAWDFVNEDSHGVAVYSKRLDEGTKEQRQAFKIQGCIKMSQADFKERFFSPKGWAEVATWNDMMEDSRILQHLGDDVSISYQRTMSIGPWGAVSARDFVFLGKVVEHGESSFVVQESVELASCPPLKNVVRAIFHPSCAKLEPSPSGDPSECLLTWMIDIDIKCWHFPEPVYRFVYKYLASANFQILREHIASDGYRKKNGKLLWSLL